MQLIQFSPPDLHEKDTPQLSINTTNCVYPMTIRHAGSFCLPTRGLLFIFDSQRRSQLTGIGIIRLACAVFIGRPSSSARVPTAKPSKVCVCVCAFRGLLPCLNVMSTDTNILQKARASSHVMFMDLLGGKSHDISTWHFCISTKRIFDAYTHEANEGVHIIHTGASLRTIRPSLFI